MDSILGPTRQFAFHDTLQESVTRFGYRIGLCSPDGFLLAARPCVGTVTTALCVVSPDQTPFGRVSFCLCRIVLNYGYA